MLSLSNDVQPGMFSIRKTCWKVTEDLHGKPEAVPCSALDRIICNVLHRPNWNLGFIKLATQTCHKLWLEVARIVTFQFLSRYHLVYHPAGLPHMKILHKGLFGIESFSNPKIFTSTDKPISCYCRSWQPSNWGYHRGEKNYDYSKTCQ